MGRTCRPMAPMSSLKRPLRDSKGGKNKRFAKKQIRCYDGTMTLTDTIRQAIKTCEVDKKRIADDTGINSSVISRFVRGHQGISLSTADKLAAYFGYELKKKKRGSKNGS